MSNLKTKAKAIVAVRRRREAAAKEKEIKLQRASERLLVDRLLSEVRLPTPNDGKDGRDAPTLSEIVAEVIPLLPKPENTVIKQEINPEDMEEFIKGLLPEIDPLDRPKVEQITNTIDISDEKLDGLVTQKEFNKALQRVQDAITASQSGGRSILDLANIIEVSVDTTIPDNQLKRNQINIIMVTADAITVTLPTADPTVIVWVQKGQGVSTYTVA